VNLQTGIQLDTLENNNVGTKMVMSNLQYKKFLNNGITCSIDQFEASLKVTVSYF